MGETLRFGGRPSISPAPVAVGNDLNPLLRELSWKYVKQEAEFDSNRSMTDLPADELRGKIAGWAGRVWFHSNEMPMGAALRAFDIMSLEGAFRKYIRTHGKGLFDYGMTFEEIWASQELYSAKPMAAVVARRYANLLTTRMEPTRIQNPQAIVWTLGAMCFQLPRLLDGQGFNVLTTNGNSGHTISIKGLNGIDFDHPRGTRVRAGWFSFHDPWPARSLLAPERNFSGVRVLEDVTRPPMWLISPEDLDKVIVGYLLPIDIAAPAFLDIFRLLDFVEKVHAGMRQPLWIDEQSPDPEQPFGMLFAMHKGVAPTTAEGLLGLGRVRLLMENLDGAIECFEGTFKLGLPGAAQLAASLLASAGYESLARKWVARTP
jgi:hypothetical protein